MNIFVNLKTVLNQAIDAESKKFEDLVKIVRCKNCKYFKPSDEYRGQCELLIVDMNNCDYCSYGARKENEE